MSTASPAPPDAFSLVSQSFSEGWRRMVFLMFRGPAARASNWFVWGFIVLIAGLLGGGGGFNFGDISRHDRPGHVFDLPHHMLGPGLVAAVILGVALAVILMLIWMYLQARFRFVFVEGVIAGEPRIRGVFRRTRAAGLSYFLFRLVMLFVLLLALGLAALAWGGALIAMCAGRESPGPGTVAGLILTALLYVLPLLVLFAIIEWFVHHLVLPHMWLRSEGLGAAFRRAWSITKQHFGATLLLFVLQLVAHIVATAAVVCVVCLTCCVWIWPALAIAGLAVASAAAPVVLIVTAPLIIALALGLGWLFCTILSPIPVFFRAWSLAFIAGVDPTLNLGAAGAPAAPQAPKPPPPEVPPPAVPPSPAPPPWSDIPPRAD